MAGKTRTASSRRGLQDGSLDAFAQRRLSGTMPNSYFVMKRNNKPVSSFVQAIPMLATKSAKSAMAAAGSIGVGVDGSVAAHPRASKKSFKYLHLDLLHYQWLGGTHGDHVFVAPYRLSGFLNIFWQSP